LESGRVHRSIFILAVINGALGKDTDVLENKTIVGLAFAKAGRDSLEEAKKIMVNITGDIRSVEKALETYGLINPYSLMGRGECKEGVDDNCNGLSEKGDTQSHSKRCNGEDCGNESDTSEEETSGSSQAESRASGWYMRTIATAVSSDGQIFGHKTAGVFGELDESVDGLDRHDIEAFGKAVFQVRFINKSFGTDRDYFSDYRTYYGSESKQVWTFQIKNQKTVDLSNATVRLAVEGPYDVFKNKENGLYIEELSPDQSKKRSLILVDVDNQETYSYNELSYTTFSMDGQHTRTFRWVLGSVDPEDMKPVEENSAANQRMMTLPAKASKNRALDIRQKGSSKFGLPPE